VICSSTSEMNIAYGVWEFTASIVSIVNGVTAVKVASGRRAWRVPLLYMLGYVVVPVGHAGTVLVYLMLLVLLFRTWSLGVLGWSYSVGVPTWDTLAETGPYRWVRHPLELSGVLARIIFACGNPCLWNIVGSLACVQAAVWTVNEEERFLQEIPAWRNYCRNVKWRLVPGLV